MAIGKREEGKKKKREKEKKEEEEEEEEDGVLQGKRGGITWPNRELSFPQF